MLFKMVNGVQTPLTNEEIADFEARELAHLAAIEEKVRNQYKLDRAAEYPSLADQLDMIYHGGLDAWKAAIKAVKDKHPKPE